MIAYVLPTRNRPAELAVTLDALAALPPHQAEVIVIDNASDVTPRVPIRLGNDLPVRLIVNHANAGAAARNLGVQASDRSSRWIVMLDDDSHPLTGGHIAALRHQPSEVLALQAEIWLSPPGRAAAPRRESGGLPEIFIGCGVAIRRDAFLGAGGYDASFDYYAEEYDLAARLLLAGGRVSFDPRFQIHHRKVTQQRSMDRILHRLVRNNAWVMRRYAPASQRSRELRRTIARYGRIAVKERAELGFASGVLNLARTLRAQPLRPMPESIWRRFTGADACFEALRVAQERTPFRRACLVADGKNAHVVAAELHALDATIVDSPDQADARVIATLSPGPMLDAADALRGSPGPPLITPWNPEAPDPGYRQSSDTLSRSRESEPSRTTSLMTSRQAAR